MTERTDETRIRELLDERAALKKDRRRLKKKLRVQAENHRRENENRQWGDGMAWREPIEVGSPEDASLPVPRLETRWQPLMGEGAGCVAINGLVMRDYDSMEGKTFLLPLNATMSRGRELKSVIAECKPPWRGGVAQRADMIALRLPAFTVVEDKDRKIVAWSEVEFGGPDTMPAALLALWEESGRWTPPKFKGGKS